MNAKDSDVEAMRKEFVCRTEYERLSALVEQMAERLRPSADICPTCGLPSKHKLTDGDSDDA